MHAWWAQVQSFVDTKLHSRITTNSRELREHQIQSENTMLSELRSMKSQLSARVNATFECIWQFIAKGRIIRKIFDYVFTKEQTTFT